MLIGALLAHWMDKRRNRSEQRRRRHAHMTALRQIAELPAHLRHDIALPGNLFASQNQIEDINNIRLFDD